MRCNVFAGLQSALREFLCKDTARHYGKWQAASERCKKGIGGRKRGRNRAGKKTE